MPKHHQDAIAKAQRLRKAEQKRARLQRTAARRARQSDRLQTNLSFENYLEKARRRIVLMAEFSERMRRMPSMKHQKAVQDGKLFDLMALQLFED